MGFVSRLVTSENASTRSSYFAGLKWCRCVPLCLQRPALKSASLRIGVRMFKSVIRLSRRRKQAPSCSPSLIEFHFPLSLGILREAPIGNPIHFRRDFKRYQEGVKTLKWVATSCTAGQLIPPAATHAKPVTVNGPAAARHESFHSFLPAWTLAS